MTKVRHMALLEYNRVLTYRRPGSGLRRSSQMRQLPVASPPLGSAECSCYHWIHHFDQSLFCLCLRRHQSIHGSPCFPRLRSSALPFCFFVCCGILAGSKKLFCVHSHSKKFITFLLF